jgi:Cysteine dioxygenase type I
MVVDQLPFPARMLQALAFDAAEIADPARLSVPPAAGRNFVRLRWCEAYDIWLIRWGPGSATGRHDHGGSVGAFCVIEGALEEWTPGSTRTFAATEHRVMPSAHIHLVRNPSPNEVATSVHVYSPPLDAMRHYDAQLHVVDATRV